MFIIVLLSIISPSLGDLCNGSIVDAFLAEYDYTVRPTEDATVVTLNLDIRHVSLNEKEAQMLMFADFNMSWNDSRLSWNETEWGCSTVMVDVDRIWKPEVDTEGVQITDTIARVDPNGLVLVSVRVEQNFNLDLDFRDWPQDSQKAEFPFISPANFWEVVFDLGGNKVVTLHESGSWEIGAVKERLVLLEGRSGVVWSIYLIRRQPALVLAVHSVIACSGLLVLATLMMPPAQRASLALAAVLCTSIWLSSCVCRLPATKTTPISVSVVAALTSIAALTALSGCAHNSTPQRFVVGLLAKYKITTGMYGDVVKTLDLIICGLLLLTVFIVLLVYACA